MNRIKKGICGAFILLVAVASALGTAAKAEGKADNLPIDIENDNLPTLRLEFTSDSQTALVSGCAAGEELNTATAEVALLSAGTDMVAQKADLFLRFEDATGLLGLKKGKEFLLLGGMRDKSLIRNYVGYRIADEVMEGTRQYQLCEVTISNKEGEHYQGVYLLAAKESNANVVFQRSTKAEGIKVETYATQKYPGDGEMAVSLFEGEAWDDRFNDYISLLSATEAILYSDDYKVYYGYSEAIDVDTFVKSFLIQELMENYDGLKEEYISYDMETQKLSMAPIWNFETAIDNQEKAKKLAAELPFTKAGYYSCLFNSPQFAEQCQEMYLELRIEVLNEDNLMKIVDEAVEQVEPALERDWERWDNYQKFKLKPSTGETVSFNRQTETYDEEISRIKYRLRSHSLNMGIAIASFDFSGQEVNREIALEANPIWVIVFLVAFFMLINFVRKYGV